MATSSSHKNRKSYFSQTPRRKTFELRRRASLPNTRKFNYELHYKDLDLREHPELYRVGVSEQGVLLVEPYKSEILPLWKFKDPNTAKKSSRAIYRKFLEYKKSGDFIGMDMARKFLQMGYTRSRRYANHSSGRKYNPVTEEVLPFAPDPKKAKSAEIFHKVWKKAEADPVYNKIKSLWKSKLG